MRLAVLSSLLLLAGCMPPTLPLPAGWPLPELRPPDYARQVALSQLRPPDRPYYSSGSDESIQAAKDTLARLGLAEPADPAMDNEAASYAQREVRSRHGELGTGWGLVFLVPGGGWDQALAQCESALSGFETVYYVPGQLRVYYSPDRRKEVILVAGKGTQLLLAINTYEPPLPGEDEQAMRDDVAHAARDLAELVKAEALELAAQR